MVSIFQLIGMQSISFQLLIFFLHWLPIQTCLDADLSKRNDKPQAVPLTMEVGPGHGSAGISSAKNQA